MLLTGQVLMIDPKSFSNNPETNDNFFQNKTTIQAPGEAAMREFQELRKKLLSADIHVHLYSSKTGMPDAVFPNNWFSTMPDGRMILYPMKSELRRKERRDDIIAKLKVQYPELIDLTYFEKEEKFLEGTGSLVIDHEAKTAFASLSQRTHSDAIKEWKKKTGYDVISFHSKDKNNEAVYHTNVVMTLCDGFSIVCDEAIADAAERKKVCSRLAARGEIINITTAQMHSFCGNCLELKNDSHRKFLVMSASAYNEFSERQKSIFIRHCTIIYANLSTIESIGGGSARCMLAELF